MMRKKKQPIEGPVDDFVLAKVRNMVLTLTEAGRLAEMIRQAAPDLSAATRNELAAVASEKLRAVLLPLVK